MIAIQRSYALNWAFLKIPIMEFQMKQWDGFVTIRENSKGIPALVSTTNPKMFNAEADSVKALVAGLLKAKLSISAFNVWILSESRKVKVPESLKYTHKQLKEWASEAEEVKLVAVFRKSGSRWFANPVLAFTFEDALDRNPGAEHEVDAKKDLLAPPKAAKE